MTTPSENTLPSKNRLRLLIVDDNPQVRQGLYLLLGLSADLEIVGEATNGLEAIEMAARMRPDVVLLDLEMPVLDGYEAARQMKALIPQGRVVALSVHSYGEARNRAAQAGVDAFIEKGAPLVEILQKIGLTA